VRSSEYLAFRGRLRLKRNIAGSLVAASKPFATSSMMRYSAGIGAAEVATGGGL